VWVPALLKEERKVGAHTFEWSAFKQFRSREVLLFLFAACASNMGLAIANFPMAKWQMERFGFSLEDVGTGSMVASVGLLVGSVCNGPLFDRVNKRAAMLVGGGLSSATLLLYMVAYNRHSVYAARFFSGLTEGALWIVQAGLTMRLADKRTGASFFSLAIMAMNLAIMLGQAIAGPLAENVSLEACFVVGGVISLLQLLPLPWLASLDATSQSSAGAATGVAAGAAGAIPLEEYEENEQEEAIRDTELGSASPGSPIDASEATTSKSSSIELAGFRSRILSGAIEAAASNPLSASAAESSAASMHASIAASSAFIDTDAGQKTDLPSSEQGFCPAGMAPNTRQSDIRRLQPPCATAEHDDTAGQVRHRPDIGGNMTSASSTSAETWAVDWAR